jgi:hypothetical protein
MKMTLDLDEDVETAIREILENESDQSFEQIINELLRTGLTEIYDSEVEHPEE